MRASERARTGRSQPRAGHGPGAAVGRDEARQRAAQRLGGAAAEHALRGRVDHDDALLLVHGDDGLASGMGRGAMHGLSKAAAGVRQGSAP